MADMNTGHRDFNADSDALLGRIEGQSNSSTSSNSDFSGTGSGGSRVGEKVRNLASTAQERAGEQVRSQAETGKTRAAGALRNVAHSLMHPDQDTGDAVSRYIRTAGDQVERAADYLENTDVRQVMSDVENFARRQPALFLGGAFALGLIAARVLKSSRSSGDMGGSSQFDNRSMYDRERSLDSYREPSTQFGGAGMGAAGSAALGGSMLGDTAQQGSTGTGNDIGTSEL